MKFEQLTKTEQCRAINSILYGLKRDLKGGLLTSSGQLSKQALLKFAVDAAKNSTYKDGKVNYEA